MKQEIKRQIVTSASDGWCEFVEICLPAGEIIIELSEIAKQSLIKTSDDENAAYCTLTALLFEQVNDFFDKPEINNG